MKRPTPAEREAIKVAAARVRQQARAARAAPRGADGAEVDGPISSGIVHVLEREDIQAAVNGRVLELDRIATATLCGDTLNIVDFHR